MQTYTTLRGSMKNFVIKADFECFVLLDGKELGILDGGELYFERPNKFVLTFFPIDNKTLPYSCKVGFENGVLHCSSELCHFVQLPNNNFELNFVPYLLSYRRPNLQKTNALETPLGKTEVRIFDEGMQVAGGKVQVLVGGELKLEYDMSSTICDADIAGHYINNEYFILIQGKVESYQYLLCINCGQSVEVNMELLAHQVEVHEDCIKTLTKCFDINKHAKVNVYEVQNGKLYKKEDYLVLLNEDIKIATELVPYAFFEAILVGDINKAREFMTQELNQAIDDAHLKAYFGDFKQVRQNIYTQDLSSVLLLYRDGNNYTSKICKLLMLDNKIDNIDIIS